MFGKLAKMRKQILVDCFHSLKHIIGRKLHVSNHHRFNKRIHQVAFKFIQVEYEIFGSPDPYLQTNAENPAV